MTRTNILEKRQAFKAMHTDGCFLLPNPWDLGSARFLAGMGFKAIASSSAGYAWTKGRPDGQLSREDVLNHLHELVEAVDVPINADFENGFAVDEDELEESIGLLLDTGVAGFSLEDSTGDPEEPLMPIEEAARRISIARALIDSTGHEVVLVGRAENFFVGVPDLDDTLERLKAYSEAGADCLYAPGIRTEQEIRAVVQAVAPKPVNVLIGWDSDLTLQTLGNMGVRRVSVGGALARTAWGGFIRAAHGLTEGRFNFTNAAPAAELNKRFS